MNKIIIALLLSSAAIAHAESDWVDIAGTGEVSYAIKKGSVTITKTTGGTNVVAALGRMSEIKSNRLNVFQMYVPISACIAKGGTLVLTDMAGAVTSKTDFVYGLGSIAAELAEAICEVSKPSKKSKPDNLKMT